MIASFRRPANVWLCIFSVIWIAVSAWFVTTFALAGKLPQAAVMSLFTLAAAGLWFQSRVAAWTLIVFAVAGVLHGLLNFGHIPLLRLVTRITVASWSVVLLAEYLRGEADS